MRSKTRLTITLSGGLVRQLDRMIDRQTIRSRSHAIEVLLRQSLQPRVGRAVLLAGGEVNGVEVPALAPIAGKPLICRTIEHLLGFGVQSFLVLAGKSRERIETLVGDGDQFGTSIRYESEERPLGTAGALKSVERFLTEGPTLVVNADVLTDIDIGDFVDFHMRQNTLATIAVKPRTAEPSYGKVMLQGNRITSFIGRGQGRGISIINTGVYLFQPEVLGLIPRGATSRLETDVFPKLAEMGELSAFLFQGVWFDIREPKHYRSAQARWRQRGGEDDAK